MVVLATRTHHSSTKVVSRTQDAGGIAQPVFASAPWLLSLSICALAAILRVGGISSSRFQRVHIGTSAVIRETVDGGRSEVSGFNPHTGHIRNSRMHSSDPFHQRILQITGPKR